MLLWVAFPQESRRSPQSQKVSWSLLGWWKVDGEGSGTNRATQAAPVPTDAMSVSLQMREREVKLWDTRRLSGATLTMALDTSPG